MKTLQTILGYLPFVLAGITAVEQNVSSAPGATKKALVMSSIQIAAKVGEQVPNSHVSAISALIDSIVAQLNASGIFTHTPAAPAKDPAPPSPNQSTTGVID